MRRLIIWITLFCFVATQTTAVAGPFEEGTAAGQAANPVIRGTVNMPSASAAVPGYTTTPPETTYYGQPSLSGPANARLTACTSTSDPVCQAQTGAVTSANTPRAPVSAYDPAVAAARDIAANPSNVLGSLADYYSGCTTAEVATPAGTENKVCNRYTGVGNYTTRRDLTVQVDLLPSCAEGTWFAHGQVNRNGADYMIAEAQCRIRADGMQLFRFYAAGGMGACIGWQALDLPTAPAPQAAFVADLSPHWEGHCWRPFKVVMMPGSGCAGGNCNYTFQFGTPVYACPAGTVRGDTLVGDWAGGGSVGAATQCFAVAPAPTYSDCPSGSTAIYGDAGTRCATPAGAATLTGASGWTLPLAFVQPTMEQHETDVWVDRSAVLPDGGRCTLATGDSCVDGPGAKTIDGRSITRACWSYERTLTCTSGTPVDECAPLASSGCTPATSTCKQINAATGVCEITQDTYACPVAAQTGLFETAFQVIPGQGALPAALSYQQNGLMFGNRLIRETGNVVFQDPAFRTDLINFIHNCTTYDLIDGTLDPAIFSASADVWPLMATPNPARFSTLTVAGGSVGVDTCPNVYKSLDGRLPAQITRIQGRLAFQLNPTLPSAAAAAVIAGQIQQAYLKNSIADAAATAADIIRQNAMLNALDDTTKIVGQKVNDPAAMVLAVGRAQAVAQQNATWLNQGKVAEQALPVFRNVVEAVTYAMFPLFVLLLLLTSGRETMLAFKGYAAVLIWIQFWPPLYAILNYMASIYAAYDLAAAADLGTGTKSLALQTASSIYSRAISGEAIVGYLAISIPFIAWAALKRLENFGTALVGGLSGLQAMISGGTSAAAVGNVSMGNVGMDQMQLAPNRTSAFMSSWQNDLSGNTFSSNALNGRTAVSLLRNQGFASRVVSMRVSEQDVVQASRQADAARSEAVAASTARSAVLSEAFSRGLSKLHSSRSSSGSTSSSFEQTGETLNKLDQITKSVADNTGLSQSQVARIAFGAAAHAGVDTGVVGAGVNASADKAYMSSLSAQEQKALASMSSEQLAKFKQFGDRVSRDTSFINAVSSDGREARDMSSRLATMTARSERADASLAERTSFAERVSAAHEKGEAISIDIAQDPHNLEMFMRYAEQYGGNSAAAHALMESELARQSLRPNRVFSDGSALPTSFGELREQHAKQLDDAALNPDIGGADQAHRERTARFGYVASTPKTTPTTSPIREEIRARGNQIRADAESSRSGFDAKAEIIKTDDGTLASKKSLLVQSGKQVGKDAGATFDNAKDVVKDVLKK